MQTDVDGWAGEMRAHPAAELEGGLTIERAEELRPVLFAELRVGAWEEVRGTLHSDLQAELRELGLLVEDGIFNLKVRARRALMNAAAAGALSPAEAGHWTRVWPAASGARVSAAWLPGGVSKMRVWISVGRSDAGLARLAALDKIASVRPAVAGRYFEKATMALRGRPHAGAN